MSCFDKIKVEIYGASHAEKIGVKLLGIPAGEKIDLAAVAAMLARRKSGDNPWSTPRREDDDFEFISGLTEEGITNGGVIEAVIYNSDIKIADYNNIARVPRPSHADFVSFVRDGVIPSGGGRFSGRMTAPICIAGAIAKQILARKGIEFHAYLSEVGGIECGEPNGEEITKVSLKPLPVADPASEKIIIDKITEAARSGDSLGAVITCVITGIEAGSIGGELFDGLEGKLSYALFAVPGVRGVEFGAGFGIARLLGSQANDPFVISGGKVATLTNNSGGINGGIANGMPIVARIAIRPTPSIGKPQRSINLSTMTETELVIKGRHDACIAPRAVPVAECAAALAILDEVLNKASEYGN